MINILNKIWKDPVWSKVIAAGIVAFFVWIFGFYSTLFTWLMKCLEYLWSNIFLTLFILSILVILILLRKLNQTQTTTIPEKEVNSNPPQRIGSNWFSTLEDDSFYKFLFLLWFPLHRTLQTEKFFYDEKFDHIPEFYDLYAHKVLFNKNVSTIEYVIAINKEVYDFLEEFYQREKGKFDIEMNKFVDMLKTVSFYELTRSRR